MTFPAAALANTHFPRMESPTRRNSCRLFFFDDVAVSFENTPEFLHPGPLPGVRFIFKLRLNSNYENRCDRYFYRKNYRTAGRLLAWKEFYTAPTRRLYIEISRQDRPGAGSGNGQVSGRGAAGGGPCRTGLLLGTPGMIIVDVSQTLVYLLFCMSSSLVRRSLVRRGTGQVHTFIEARPGPDRRGSRWGDGAFIIRRKTYETFEKR